MTVLFTLLPILKLFDDQLDDTSVFQSSFDISTSGTENWSASFT